MVNGYPQMNIPCVFSVKERKYYHAKIFAMICTNTFQES